MVRRTSLSTNTNNYNHYDEKCTCSKLSERCRGLSRDYLSSHFAYLEFRAPSWRSLQAASLDLTTGSVSYGFLGYGCGVWLQDILYISCPLYTILIRSNPTIWGLVHGMVVIYLIALTFLLFQDTVFDEFVLAHVVGWWGKAIMILNQPLLWVLFIGFELMEPSVLSKRYGSLPTEEASATAHAIEEEAFVAASAAGGAADVASVDDGIDILQVYSEEISKRMLNAVKSRGATATPESSLVQSTSAAATSVSETSETNETAPSIENESS
ncbi:hypothetical protein Dimus_004545 [Dionaea muscipula]